MNPNGNESQYQDTGSRQKSRNVQSSVKLPRKANESVPPNARSKSEHASLRTQLPDRTNIIKHLDEFQLDSKDEKFSVFKMGRDFQPKNTKHQYTEEEKGYLGQYESSGLAPSHNSVYRQWLSHRPIRSDTESWIAIVIIGILIGTLTFIMKLITERFHLFYHPFINNFIENGNYFRIWLYLTGTCTVFGALAAIIVVYFCPQAAGSGLPELIGLLNGCVIPNILGLRTLVCKIISCICTVISGLPVGYEGPMVHIGGMIAAILSRPIQCPTLKNTVYFIEEPPSPPTKFGKFCNNFISKIFRYRDGEERNNLICIGAAAGIASAFSSPITGLTFSMEEMSTHWTTSLTWQAFVCCILSRSTTELLHSIISAVEHHHSSNHSRIFKLEESALFDPKVALQFSLAVFIPAVIIGILGGLLGSLYVFMHMKMARARRRFYKDIELQEFSDFLKVAEVVILGAVFASLTVAIMPMITCDPVDHIESVSSNIDSRRMIVRGFKCPTSVNEVFIDSEDNGLSVMHYEGYFHEGASLLFGSWEQMIRNLLSRKTQDFFGLSVLLVVLIFFFVFSSYTALTAIASGLLIPQLAIGALYGRFVGKLLCDMVRAYVNDSDQKAKWDFTDPGALAILGAASFFAGTSRLPITSVVMMAEMTNDINMSLLVMVSVMIAKFIGDSFTHSIVHSMIEFKCIPIIETELKIYYHEKRVNLELFRISDLMITPVCACSFRSSVFHLASLLLDTKHGAYPVVKSYRGIDSIFLGLITRVELTVLLTKTDSFDASELGQEDIEKLRLSYPEYSTNKLAECAATNKVLLGFTTDPFYTTIFVNLIPYINLSAHRVSNKFSFARTYRMFRNLGLRHLVVVNECNQVQGIITRKDLMGDVVEEKVLNIIVRTTNENNMNANSAKKLSLHKSSNGHRLKTVHLVNEKLYRKSTNFSPSELWAERTITQDNGSGSAVSESEDD